MLYKVSATKAGQKPIRPPSSGTISTSSARLGTVWITPATPRVHLRQSGPAADQDAQRQADARPTASAASESSMWPPR